MGQTGGVAQNRTAARADGGGKSRDIVAAEQELFGRLGYNKTSVHEIAARANVALGTSPTVRVTFWRPH